MSSCPPRSRTRSEAGGAGPAAAPRRSSRRRRRTRSQIRETRRADEELADLSADATVFQSVGTVMMQKPKEAVSASLKEKVETLEVRVKQARTAGADAPGPVRDAPGRRQVGARGRGAGWPLAPGHLNPFSPALVFTPVARALLPRCDARGARARSWHSLHLRRRCRAPPRRGPLRGRSPLSIRRRVGRTVPPAPSGEREEGSKRSLLTTPADALSISSDPGRGQGSRDSDGPQVRVRSGVGRPSRPGCDVERGAR